jgi:hypothetical protein
MTLTVYGAGRAVQLLGLVGAVTSVGAVFIAPFCGSVIYATAGALGAGLDVIAVTTRRRNAAVAISIAKLPVVLAPILAFVSCGYVVLPSPPIPVDLGPSLLFASAVPSIIGALLVRFAR